MDKTMGGMRNLTSTPAGAKPQDVVAFDTGPGNMVLDQLMQLLFQKPYDRDGSVARQGTILQPLLEELLRAPYFKRRPPKTAGREEFGREYVDALLRQPRRAAQADLIPTATALTAQSIARAIKAFVLPGSEDSDYAVSGAASRNETLIHRSDRE